MAIPCLWLRIAQLGTTAYIAVTAALAPLDKQAATAPILYALMLDMTVAASEGELVPIKTITLKL